MIYSTDNNKRLEYYTPLIEHLKSNHNYYYEDLKYTNKYTEGTFSINIPSKNFCNSFYINGYPHFLIPLDLCIEEIKFFLSDKKMYNNHFYIRYVDTHPHKPVPKLAQVRNLIVENILSNMLGQNSESYYVIGDISINSIKDFIMKYNIDTDPEKMLKKLVNNSLTSNILSLYSKYNTESLNEIVYFLNLLGLPNNKFLFESSLYINQELYNSIKKKPNFKGELKNNGEMKYSLQELFFINSVIHSSEDVLINIIGNNQISHVIKVNEFLKSNFCVNNRFLTYGICKNAEERNVLNWSKKINDIIEQENLKRKNEYISYQDFLKALIIINNNDSIIDFGQLKKYSVDIKRFINNIDKINEINYKDSKVMKCDLIYKMSLVCYSLNKSIETGNYNYFYRYVLSIIREYEKHKDYYSNIETLYNNFLAKCFEKLGFNHKYVLK